MEPESGTTTRTRPRTRRRSLGRALVLVYAGLLGASHLTRALRAPKAPDSAISVELSEFDRDGARAGRVEIAFADTRRDGSLDAGTDRAAPVLLLHGSPGSRRDFDGLTAELRGERRVIAPDLPGFGASTPEVADYSVRAHARYALALLDELEIERVHVIGFSMGGGVAIELIELAPERVSSLVLLSAIGVQELELFGDYHLNHGVHGLQVAALWSAYELLPHFGAFDGGMLSVAYARNFYDTDQRPLRARLERWRAPALIVHGRGDVLVPFAAAEEHHRLLPQSELAAFDGNHFLVFRRGAELATRIAPFLRSVDGGLATTRASAESERVLRAAEPFDPSGLAPLSGFSLALLLVLAALATLVSEDLTCIAVGALVGQGRVEFLPGVLACFVGIYVGDVMLFLAGRLLGRRALGRAPLKYFLSEGRVEASSRWFDEKGGRVIFLSRFLPGLRLPTYFASGVLRTSFLRFSLWFALAAALWTPLLVWLASRIGGALSDRVELLQDNLAVGLIATLAIGFLLVKLGRPLLTRRGRRLLRASWRRTTRWEYWPRWAFYPPVVLACVWYGVRRRSPLAFTAVNPAMPHGGFVGESKADILAGLPQSTGSVARTLVLEAALSGEQVIERVRAWQDGRADFWPLVVKPDVGQRGDGVSVTRSEDELVRACAALFGRVLVQEYVGGVEFGLFYAREPEAEHGTVLSITRKLLPEVTGDGVRDLEALILDDERAVCSAEVFFEQHAERLNSVPAAGERVRLGEVGTHCRGAVFLDGADLLTPALTAAVDELSRGYEGFYFGRYDVRAASDDALRGGAFTVLELNGVTSECAHVYDPRYSVLDAWRTIAAQWRLAYDIGVANARRGARVSSVAGLMRAFRDYRRETRAGSV